MILDKSNQMLGFLLMLTLYFCGSINFTELIN